MFKKLYTFYSDKKLSVKIFLFIFALVITKSIFITPFKIINGLWGVILGVIFSAILYALLVVALYYLKFISWQYKKTIVKKRYILYYMIPTVLVYSFLLAVVFPGVVGYDSHYIWKMAHSNEFTNLHPIVYTLSVKLFSSIVDSPWLIIFTQILYTSFAFAAIAYTFRQMGLNKNLCWLTVFVLCLYPINAMNTVAMLKDVNYIVSLILMSVILIKILLSNKFSFVNALFFCAASLVALFARHNAIITIVFCLGTLLVYFKKNKQARKTIFVSVLAIFVLYFGVNKTVELALGDSYWTRSGALDMVMIPSAQLSFTVDQNWYELTDEEYNLSDKYLNLGYVTETVKTRRDWKFNHIYIFTLNYEEIRNNPMGFLKYYLSFWTKYPKDMILEYQQITGIAWAIPDYGYTLVWNKGITDFPEYESNIKEASFFPKVRDIIYKEPKIKFYLRPAMWLWLSVIVIIAFYKRHKLAPLIVALPMLSNAFGYFMGTPAQNVRYLYCNFSIFIIVLLFSTMTKTKDEKKEVS